MGRILHNRLLNRRVEGVREEKWLLKMISKQGTDTV